MINLVSSFLKDKKTFIESSITGLLVYLVSLAFANSLQFFLLININEVIRTDLTLVLSFFFGTSLNFYIHNYKIFKTNFIISNYIKFLNTNILTFIISIIFWTFFEFFSGLPSQLEFNLLSILILSILFPIKFWFYKKIFKNNN